MESISANDKASQNVQEKVMNFNLCRLYKNGEKLKTMEPTRARIRYSNGGAMAFVRDGVVLASMRYAKVQIHAEHIEIHGLEQGKEKGMFFKQVWLLARVDSDGA